MKVFTALLPTSALVTAAFAGIPQTSPVNALADLASRDDKPPGCIDDWYDCTKNDDCCSCYCYINPLWGFMCGGRCSDLGGCSDRDPYGTESRPPNKCDPPPSGEVSEKIEEITLKKGMNVGAVCEAQAEGKLKIVGAEEDVDLGDCLPKEVRF